MVVIAHVAQYLCVGKIGTRLRLQCLRIGRRTRGELEHPSLADLVAKHALRDEGDVQDLNADVLALNNSGGGCVALRSKRPGYVVPRQSGAL